MQSISAIQVVVLSFLMFAGSGPFSACAGEPPPPNADVNGNQPFGVFAKLEDGVLIQCGEIKIRLEDVERQFEPILKEERSRNKDYVLPDQELLIMRVSVGQVLFERAIIQKLAQDMKLSVSDEEVDALMKEGKRAQSPMIGESPESNRRYHAAHLALKKKVAAGATDAEIDALFIEHTSEKPLRSCAHVMFSYSGAKDADPKLVRTKEEARKMAAAALERAKAGADFAEIAKSGDDDGSKDAGGEIGFIPRSASPQPFPPWGSPERVKLLAGPTYALDKVGALSSVFESEYGFHVVKLTGNREKEFRPEILEIWVRQKIFSLVEDVIRKSGEKFILNETYFPRK